MTSVTIKTYPEMPVASMSVMIGAEPDSEAFWNFTTFIVSSAPQLQDSEVMGYCYVAPASPYNGTIVGGYLGALLLPNGTVAELQQATSFLQQHIGNMPGVQSYFNPVQYPTLYAWYQANKNTAPVGGNTAVGNQLLDAKALSDVGALRKAMKKATPKGTLANLNLVAGPGLWSARPAGGGNSATPAWTTAYVEYGTSNLIRAIFQIELLTDCDG